MNNFCIEMSEDLDNLIIEKVQNFKSWIKTITTEDKHENIHNIPFDIKKLDIFRLFLLTGGTPDALHSIITKRFGMENSSEHAVKLGEYCNCLFDLLCLRLKSK